MGKSTTSRKRIIAECSADIADSVVFAGIDYHKKHSVITLGDKDGTRIWQEKIFNDRETIISFFKRFPAGVSCAIENTRATEWFIELLKEIGLKVHVSNTYAVKLITESRCKNDKIDSRVLMELLAKGFLPLCYQPSREERLLKEQLKWRIHLGVRPILHVVAKKMTI